MGTVLNQNNLPTADIALKTLHNSIFLEKLVHDHKSGIIFDVKPAIIESEDTWHSCCVDFLVYYLEHVCVIVMAVLHHHCLVAGQSEGDAVLPPAVYSLQQHQQQAR